MLIRGSLERAKMQLRLLCVSLARPQDGAGKGRLIWGVGKVLRLQAQAGSITVNAPLTGLLAVHEIAGVELYARLRGAHFQYTAANRVGEQRPESQRIAVRRVQSPIMVVAMPDM